MSIKYAAVRWSERVHVTMQIHQQVAPQTLCNRKILNGKQSVDFPLDPQLTNQLCFDCRIKAFGVVDIWKI